MMTEDRLSKNDPIAKRFLNIKDDSLSLFLEDKFLQGNHDIGTLETKNDVFVQYLLHTLAGCKGTLSVVSLSVDFA